jgi:predicted DNA-binding protein with PD1-like motif
MSRPRKPPEGQSPPRMQVELLNPGEAAKQYAVIFYQGDEAFSGLLDFAEQYHVTSAHFTAIGALNKATLGWFDTQRKIYKKIPVNGQHEVIGMSGDIALYQGKPVVHTHMVVGSPDGTTLAGQVLDAYVSPTLEVMVTVDPVAIKKRFDAETDLTLIDPGLK